MSDADFMAEITAFTGDIVKSHTVAAPEYAGLFSMYASVGVCPRCKKAVREYYKSFSCESRECGFSIWKANKLFASAKKELTAKIVSELLRNGRAKVNGLYSEKKNRTYDAFISLDDTGKYVNFKGGFENKK
jgi:DNA topoisomerase-3